MRTLLIPLMAAAALASCHGSAPASAAKPEVEPPAPEAPAAMATERVIGSTPAMLPRATVYRTSEPVDSFVPISLNKGGDEVISFPAPSDVSDANIPIKLPDGWLLDRRGIGPNTAFIRLTYAQYAALPAAPTTAELLDMIIPGAHVTDLIRLSMTPQQAAADTAAVVAEIRAARQ